MGTRKNTECLLNIGELNDQYKNDVRVDIMDATLKHSQGMWKK